MRNGFFDVFYFWNAVIFATSATSHYNMSRSTLYDSNTWYLCFVGNTTSNLRKIEPDNCKPGVEDKGTASGTRQRSTDKDSNPGTRYHMK
jgi:hypothetical protein